MSTDCRSTVDRLSTEWRSTVGRVATECRSSIDRVSTATSTDIADDITYSKHDPIFLPSLTIPLSKQQCHMALQIQELLQKKKVLYMKDSIKYRGAVLWNAMNAKHRDLAQSSSFGSLKKNLNNLVALRDFGFSITSALTNNFRRDGFTYY